MGCCVCEIHKNQALHAQWIVRKHRHVVRETIYTIRRHNNYHMCAAPDQHVTSYNTNRNWLFIIFDLFGYSASSFGFYMRQYVSDINHFVNSISFMVCLRRSMLQHHREPLRSTLNQLLYNCLVARICLFAYFIDVTQTISCRVSLPLFSANCLLNKSVYDEHRYKLLYL